MKPGPSNSIKPTARRCLAATLGAAALILPPQAAHSDAAFMRRIDENSIVFNGLITEDSVRQFLQLVRPNDKVVITSPGGDAAPAIRMGKAVRAMNLMIDVSGNCFSACAELLFIPARRRGIEDGSMVLVHDSPLNSEQALRTKPDIFTHAEAKEVRRQANEIRSLYRAAGVSTALLSCADMLQEFNLEGINRNSRGGVSIPRKYPAVYLSTAVLKAYGVPEPTPNWRNDTAPFRAYYEHVFGGQIVWFDRTDQCPKPARR